jgi:hypothetical protein
MVDLLNAANQQRSINSFPFREIQRVSGCSHGRRERAVISHAGDELSIKVIMLGGQITPHRG